jgi:uncharacterized membrane protein YccC
MDAIQTTTPAVATPVATPSDAPVKPGYQTTEFWLSAAATLVGLAIASGIVPTTGNWPQIVGLITGVLGAMGYTVSRTAVKNG